MPAVNFKLAWPDGEQQEYYCPSTVIYHYFEAGQQMSQREFSENITAALNAASDRVHAKFGYHCSAASAELQKINDKLKQLKTDDITGDIRLVEFQQ